MKLEWTFLRSKVARRIFTLFVLCALLPIAALAVASFIQVTGQLHQQSRGRLRQATKAIGLSIYERLLFLEGEMRLVASNTVVGTRTPSGRLAEDLATRFQGLTLLTDADRRLPVFGRSANLPELNAAERQHLSSGKTLVSTDVRFDGPVRVFMSLSFDPQNP